VVLAYSTICSAGETLVEVYKIPSAIRKIDYERIEWTVPFRVSSAVPDSARDLVLLFQELESEPPTVHDPRGEAIRERCVFLVVYYVLCAALEPALIRPHLLHARTLDGRIYPAGKHGLHVEDSVPIQASHALMEACPSICGNYLLWPSDGSVCYGVRRTPLYDWTRGYEVFEVDGFPRLLSQPIDLFVF
jgi:hypothetical protein